MRDQLMAPHTDPKADEKQARLKAAAERALAEAEARRIAETAQEQPTELGGRNGPNPTRYGDWEKKGVAVDFS